MTSGNIIELCGVRRAFNGPRGEVSALDGVDLDIAAGEFLTVVGPSGCGKSTLLNIIVGLLAPTAGEQRYADAAYHGVNRDIGYVTQADNLFPWRTALRNVTFGLEMRRIGDRGERRRHAARCVRADRGREFAEHYRHELSGGMRQRINIVRTLACNPKVILLDEPFGPLDVQNRLQLQDLLLGLWQRPGSVREIVPVGLPRPRDLYTIHTDPGFRAIYDQIWAHLAEEMRVSAP